MISELLAVGWLFFLFISVVLVTVNYYSYEDAEDIGEAKK